MSESSHEGSAPAPTTQRTFEFSPEQLQKFLTEKWKLNLCEVCLVSQWGYDAENYYSVLPTSDGRKFSTISPKLTVHLRIFCRNCGNTKLLLVPVISRWLEENP